MSAHLRWVALLAVAAIVAAACGAPSETPDELPLADDQPTTHARLVFATSDPAGVLTGVAEWERAHPTARVEIDVGTADDIARNLLDDEPHNDPDVVALGPAIGPRARQRPERFIDLTPHISTGLTDDYSTQWWDAARADTGELIAVPGYTTAYALAVRTDLLTSEQVAALDTADDWCELLAIADTFADTRRIAFLGTPTELARAQLAQTTDIPGDREALRHIWDLTMSALGEAPLHGDPCPDHDPIGRITRNFAVGDAQWDAAARVDGFAAAIISSRHLDALASAAPDTAQNWRILDLPGPAGASDNAVHFAVPAGSAHPELAIDLVMTLTDERMQRRSYGPGSPVLPSATDVLDDAQLADALDPFFGPAARAPFLDAAKERPDDTGATPERAATIAALLDAIRDVANDARTPAEAWAIAIGDR